MWLPLSYYTFSGLFNFITTLTIALIVIFASKSPAGKTFSLVSLTVAQWSLFYFLWLITSDIALADFHLRTCMAGVCFMPVLFLHFIFHLVQKPIPRKYFFTNYLLSTLFAASVYTPLYAKGGTRFLIFPYWPFTGPVFHLFIMYFFILFSYSFYLMYKKLKTIRGTYRNQVLYVFTGFIIGVISGSTNYFCWYRIPIPPFLNIFVSLYVIFTAYAILKHKLMDIKIVFHKTLAYSLILSLLFVITVIILFTVGQFFGVYTPQKTFLPTLMIVTILAFIFQPLYRWCTSLMDRLFFKGTLPKVAEELQRSEKLASLGILASGLAHEIKNPLAPIKTYIQNLPSNANDPKYIDKISKIIPTEIDKITDIINQLRDFANLPELSISKVNIHNLIDKRLNLLEHDFTSRKISVEKKYSPHISEIDADPTQLERVFLNLFLNAIEAMPNGGRLTIATEDSILIRVSDTGIGIDKEALPHIFDPFYSKGKHKGMGLGLAIVYRIIKEHNGSISVESQPGKGTAFSISIPYKY